MQHIVAAVIASRSREKQRFVFSVVFRCNLHTVEDTMILVLGCRGKHNLTIGGELKVDIMPTVVGECVAAYFCATVFQH